MAEVVYVCQTFPWVTQTFTVREVALLREQGLDVAVVSFRRPPDALMDTTARELLACTTFFPPLSSAAVLRPLLRALLRHPGTLLRLGVLALISRGELRTPLRMRLLGAIAAVRGAWIDRRFPEAGLFHAEFADEAATAAMVAAELSGRRFSFKSHASFNPQLLSRKAARAAFVATENAFDRRHYFAAVPDERILVNRGGVVPDGAQPRIEAADGVLRILSVGTLQEKKGHRYLLGALRLLRDRGVPFRCLIVGSGPLEDELRAAVGAAALESQVRIEGYRPHEEVLDLYPRHDAFALPCVVTADGDRDGIPNVLIEAGAAGCALVSTAVSGIPELIRHGESGLVVPERDEEALAEALARLVDPELRASLARGAQDVIRDEFDLRRNVAELAARFRLELSRA